MTSYHSMRGFAPMRTYVLRTLAIRDRNDGLELCALILADKTDEFGAESVSRRPSQPILLPR